MRRTTANTALAVLLLIVPVSPAAAQDPMPADVEAGFRGCEAEQGCRFVFESSHSSSQWLRYVRPAGVVQAHGDATLAIAVRDRLNALLSSMIHQHKRIALHGLRQLPDGAFVATVTINGVDVASDPELLALRARVDPAIRR